MTEYLQILELSKAEQSLCMKSFSRVDFEGFRNRNPDRVPLTCEWLLVHPSYLTWRNKDESSLLWISADPGCGKSVMAKFLVDHLRETKSENDIPELVCHFFFKDDNATQRSAVLCLNAILHQIFQDDPSLLRHVFPKFESKGTSMKYYFNTLWQILLAVTRDPEATNLVFIIDGLDECDQTNQTKLLNALSSFYARSSRFLRLRPYVKFLVFSRPENTIKSHFSRLPEIRLRGEDETGPISQDVERFIQYSIDQLEMQGLPVNLLTDFQTKLVEGADRTFLWATLMIQLLKESSTDGVSQTDLQMFLASKDLYGLYSHLLQRSKKPAEARKLLQLIVAAARPLTLDELNIALNAGPGLRSLNDLNSALKYPCENYLKSLCGHFIRIIRSEVYLVHQTAREFLLQETQETNHPPLHSTSNAKCTWQHTISMVESQRVLLVSCMSYILLLGGWETIQSNVSRPKGTNTRKLFQESCENHPFLNYASTQWPTHFREAVKMMEDGLVNDAQRLCDPSFAGCEMWLSGHSFYTAYFFNLPVQEVQLRVSIFFGLEILARSILSNHHVNLNSVDTLQQTVLHLACWNGQTSIAELLLEQGANTEDRDEELKSPLHLAAQGDLVEITASLLKHGADIEARDRDSRTAIHLAVVHNNFGVVKLLLERGGNPKTYDEKHRTPLLDALAHGPSHQNIAKMLVDSGVDVNATDEEQRTTLHLAVESGDLTTLNGVLALKADVSLEDTKGDTALHILRRKPTLDLRNPSAMETLVPNQAKI